MNGLIHFRVKFSPSRKTAKRSMNSLEFGIGHKPIAFYHKGEHFLSLFRHVWPKFHQVFKMSFSKNLNVLMMEFTKVIGQKVIVEHIDNHSRIVPVFF